MEKFTRLDGIGCPLAVESVDTDQLIPARFMSRSRVQGYGGYLLHDARFDPVARNPAAATLDDARYEGARVLVSRRNFGCGSSREAAVYALWDFGLRCVIAPSFGDIFASNAIKNGLLPAVVDAGVSEALLTFLQTTAVPRIAVDLEAQTVTFGRSVAAFHIDPVARQRLLNGWDDLDMTRQYRDTIEKFRTRHRGATAGAWPTKSD
jgi:3-isopropylmalate/(R)-2-methylmalate dehydratase small subunit